MRKLITLALVLALSLVAAGCGSDDDEDAAGTTSAAATTTTDAASDCAKESLELISDGTLTIGTDNPAFPPWFEGGSPEGSDWEINDPATGEGFESAVAYAVAEELGFTEDEVEWAKVPFNAVVSPGEKNFDFDVNQVSITEERRQAVDFSSGYYDVRQVVVTTAGSAIDGATSIAELQDAKLGAQVGTTSYTAITDQIQSSQEAAPFDTNDQAVQALNNGQIDGIVVDLPTAYFMTAVQLNDGAIVGQLPQAGGEVEQFGAVLDLDSPLTDCVSEAVDTLREDGTLDELADEWLAQQGAPELS